VFGFVPFSEGNCGDTTPVLVNEFKEGQFVKSVEEIFVDKTRDLKGCEVRIATSDDSQPYVFVDLLANGSYNFHGRDVELVNALAKSINFRINYTFVGEEGSLAENGTGYGPFLMLLEDKADLIMADYWLVIYRLKFVDTSVPYIYAYYAFMIPPGGELSSFEKFVKPLDRCTWSLLLVFIGFGFIVIFLMKKFSSKSTRNFVFGIGVNHPSLNIITAIYGGSQKVLPRESFGRYLLMMFLIFCLVMRTLYSGSLFRFIQSKVYHKEVQSSDEMIERDFKIYFLESSRAVLLGAEKLNDR
jgi:hypothetical protein